MTACEAKEIADLIEAILTSVGIIVAGIWSYLLFIKRRQKYPRAVVEHYISHRRIDDNAILLVVDSKVTNIGDVLLSLTSAETRIQQILPLDAEMLQAIGQGKPIVQEDDTEAVWPLIHSKKSNWTRRDFQIEPGESDHIRYDFILVHGVQTIEVYTYIDNESIRSRKIGWSTTTLYDLDRVQKQE